MAAQRDHMFDHTMSFGDHLEELRRRVLLAIVAPLPLAILLFIFSNTLVQWLRLPVSSALRANDLPEQLQVLSPTEMIMLQMKLSLIAAFVLSAPWVLYQAWKFIEPGLFAHERRFVRFLIPLSALLSIAGVATLYFLILPLMLRVLILFGTGVPTHTLPADVAAAVETLMEKGPSLRIATGAPEAPQAGDAWLTWPALELHAAVQDAAGTLQVVQVPRALVQQQFRLSEYIDLVLLMMVAVVIAFQMPLVIALLGWMGLATPQWLRARRKYALMICAVLAVVITPPDAVSMILMLIPLYALYELGILLLVIAPASAVAEGRVFSLRRLAEARSADNRREPADRIHQTRYTDETKSTQSDSAQPASKDADSGEQGS